MEEFKIGDRIRMTRNFDCAEKDMVGTILALAGRCCRASWGVKFDNKFDGGNSLSGKCADGYGHWIPSDAMEPLQNKFEVGQVYRILKRNDVVGDPEDIIKIVDVCSQSNDIFEYRAVRGCKGKCGLFSITSEFASSLELLSGKEIGEAIRKWDADHAKKEPEYKEVKRHAKVGEKIKLTSASSFYLDRVGDVLTVDGCNENAVYVKGFHHPRQTGRDETEWCYFDREYVVLEPCVKEVKRHAKAGEYIKIIKSPYGFDRVGDILKMGADDHILGKNHLRRGYDNACEDSFAYCYLMDFYVVLEGYKSEKKGKRVYSLKQIDEAKKITLRMINEVYFNGDEALFFSDVDKKAYYAILIKNGTCCDFGVTSNPVGSTTTIHSQVDSTIVSNAICSHNDEPNEWIGKCVALCKALDKPIPKFIMDGD